MSRFSAQFWRNFQPNRAKICPSTVMIPCAALFNTNNSNNNNNSSLSSCSSLVVLNSVGFVCLRGCRFLSRSVAYLAARDLPLGLGGIACNSPYARPAWGELLNSRIFSLLPLLPYTSSVSIACFVLSLILPLGFLLSTARFLRAASAKRDS